MIILWIKDSEIRFADPDTGKRMWYGSDVFKGDKLEYLSIQSQTAKELRVVCIDGEIGIIDPETIQFI